MNPLKKYYLEGYSFFNTGTLKKECKTYWYGYKTKKPTDEEFRKWSKWSIQNWAIVCGEISGILVIDVDPKNGGNPTPFQNLGMYEVHTPSGGYHFYCRYTPLFNKIKHIGKDTDSWLRGVDILSNGGLVFAPPTKFENGEYKVVNDVPVGEMPESVLKSILEELDRLDDLRLESKKTIIGEYKPRSINEADRPGDIFNKIMSWEQLLIPKGWTKAGYSLRDGKQLWCRPGKDHGVSASTNFNGNDLLHVFTSSTELSPDTSYSKFAFITITEYNGDYRAAARDLKLRNYQLIHQQPYAN